MNKNCTKCGIEKPLSDFYKEKRALDGKTSQCKNCLLNNQKSYHNTHKKEQNERCKEYYITHKWKFILNGIKQRCTDNTRHNYNRYGERNIKCLITENEIKFLYERDKANELQCPSIDRKDNNGHYTLENCQFIEHKENSGKDKRKPILQFDLNGVFIKEWISQSEIKKQLNIGHVYLSCNGIRPIVSGFKWEYKNEK